jgi:hypothetical protein
MEITMTKITRSTIKSFINNNEIFIKKRTEFSGYTDGVENYHDQSIKRAERLSKDNHNYQYNLGIKGAWFVGSSRDYFEPVQDGHFYGYEVYNSCGSFYLLTPKKSDSHDNWGK